MHITVDAQHADPLRRALIGDCAGRSWSLCVAVLPGAARIRLSLTLPKIAVDDALAQISHLAPGAEVGHLLEIPDEPSGPWRDLIHGVKGRHTPHACRTEAPTIGSILQEDDVVLGCDAVNQRTLFQLLGTLASRRYGLDAVAVADGLAAREALGSTGLGQGVAVPHGRISGVSRELAFYVRAASPIPFNAPDGHPVSDFVCLLLPDWANNTHLQLLASTAQFFCNERYRLLLRDCDDSRSVCRVFSAYAS
jgi:PTS system nitrogen regulatory IIA component